MQKIKESHQVAKLLGGSSITLNYKDAELVLSDEIITEVAKHMRRLRPDLVITHWEKSIHPDHMLCQQIVQAAQLKTGLVGFEL